MARDRIKALISMTVVPPVKAGSPLRTISVDWDEAVCAAAARLDAGWIMPETRCHPAAAEELAAFLCAFGA